jgi:hypothetical protein
MESVGLFWGRIEGLGGELLKNWGFSVFSSLEEKIFFVSVSVSVSVWLSSGLSSGLFFLY